MGPAPAQAAGKPGSFYDGNIAYSTITNCVSIIQGAPYQENGAGVYTGAYADPDETPPVPSVNQPFYMHVVVYGLGNSCSGQRFVPAIDLPAGVSFDTTNPILCFTAAGQVSGATDCPQWGNVVPSTIGGDKEYRSSDTANVQTWPLPTGKFWEFRFPITSPSTQSNATMHAFVKMIDGNSSPTLDARAPLYVFGAASPASLLYDSPSTVAAPKAPDGTTTPLYGLYSTANYFTNGQAGTGTFDIGTAPGVYPQHVSFSLPTGSPSWLVWTDWDESGVSALVPGTTYYWRATFTPTAGAKINGAEQRFKVPASKTCGGQLVTVSLALGQQPTEGNDVILGTDASESISGGGGNDIICAAGGNDTVAGGAGNDTIDGGSGTDTASYAGNATAVTVSLGTSALQNTLGAGSDQVASLENLMGSSLSDTLTGSIGNNTIDGGDGADTMAGGTGNDTYTCNASNDVITGETSTSGIDTVKSTVTRVLGSTLENLTLTGSAPINATGNSAANVLIGNSGNNILNGSSAADTYTGGAGADGFTASSISTFDLVTDFTPGTDKARISQSGWHIGDSDLLVEGATTKTGPGGFSNNAELVIITNNVTSLTASNEAAAIGSATGTYAVGARRMFIVDNGTTSQLLLFTSTNTDAKISSSEIRPMMTFKNRVNLTTNTVQFVT